MPSNENLELFVIDHILDLIHEIMSYDENNIIEKLEEKRTFYMNIKSQYEKLQSE